MATASDIVGAKLPAATAKVLSRGAAYDSSNISSSDAPSLAEINAAFGTAAGVGAGFIGWMDDNGAGTNGVMVVSDGTNWFLEAFAKAS